MQRRGSNMAVESGRSLVKGKRNKRGSSLISIMIAFALLLIGLGMLSTALFVAMDVTNHAQTVRKDMEAAMKMYYHGEGTKRITEVFPKQPINFILSKDGQEISDGFLIMGECREFTYNSIDDGSGFYLYEFR